MHPQVFVAVVAVAADAQQLPGHRQAAQLIAELPETPFATEFIDPVWCSAL